MVSAMREPYPEHVRRTLEACRQNPARDVLSSRGWAELRDHCGELAVKLDTLGYHPIAQRVDRDYARLHEQVREAATAASATDGLLLTDAVEELASTRSAMLPDVGDATGRQSQGLTVLMLRPVKAGRCHSLPLHRHHAIIRYLTK
jgi:hypothetical protein